VLCASANHQETSQPNLQGYNYGIPPTEVNHG
jgi:hypothetical protein